MILTRAARRKELQEEKNYPGSDHDLVPLNPPPITASSPPSPGPTTTTSFSTCEDISSSNSSDDDREEDERKCSDYEKPSNSSKKKQQLWVQCEHLSCQKWRLLPKDTQINQNSSWYCSMHPDPTLQSCDAPEQEWKKSKKRTYTFSKLNPGQLVWAKMHTFSPWPAIISPDPWSDNEYMCKEREGCIYHVEFLGKIRTHLWMMEERVEPYHENVCSLGCVTLKNKPFRSAVEEANFLSPLTNEQRLATCKYNEDFTKGKSSSRRPRTEENAQKQNRSNLSMSEKLSPGSRPRKRRRRKPKNMISMTSENFNSSKVIGNPVTSSLKDLNTAKVISGLAPSIVSSQTDLLSAEEEAQKELREIESLLSMFGEEEDTVQGKSRGGREGGADQRHSMCEDRGKGDHGNEEQESEWIEMVQGEIDQIQGLIQDLAKAGPVSPAQS